MCECRQGFTHSQNASWGFFPCSTPPTYETFSHGVVFSKEAGNNPGFHSVKGQ